MDKAATGVALFAALVGVIIAFPILLLVSWVRAKGNDKMHERIERDRQNRGQ